MTYNCFNVGFNLQNDFYRRLTITIDYNNSNCNIIKSNNDSNLGNCKLVKVEATDSAVW